MANAMLKEDEGDGIHVGPMRPLSTTTAPRVKPRTAPKPGIGYLLSAAIDIGTSSSCYAFSVKTSPQDIKMNKNWGSSNGYQSYKSPTVILTEKGPNGKMIAFGYEAQDQFAELVAEGQTTECNLYKDYKMILYREKQLHKKNTIVESQLGTKRPLMDMYVMTLKYMRQNMLDEIAVSAGAVTIKDNDIRWVLCVPATWNDKAKDFLRHAAYKAGLITDVQSPQLVIILEATAAALFCTNEKAQFYRDDPKHGKSIPPGEKYLVIDAGAGTVDYTAQETLEGGRVKEIALANGGDWGGGHVDKRFEELFREVLGTEFIDKFQKKHPQNWFEIEYKFEKCKARSDKDVNIELPAIIERFMRDEQDKNICTVISHKVMSHQVKESNGTFIIKKAKVLSLFKPTIDKIVDMARTMLDKNLLHGLNCVFLVGGFAMCPLLQTEMLDKVRDVKLAIPKEARMAVVQGAVIYGHNPNIITRKAKKTYGVGTYSEFKERTHSALKKTVLGAHSLCADVFLPFVQKGDELEPGTHGTMVASPVAAQATSVVVEFYHLDRVTSPNETLYCDSEGVEKLGQVRVEMPDITRGLNREITLNFRFDDEINVTAWNPDTKKKTEAQLQFDYDIRG